MNVLVRRHPELDHGLELDLSHTDLRKWKPANPDQGRAIHLRGADLTGSDLSNIELSDVDLAEAKGLPDNNMWASNVPTCCVKARNLQVVFLRVPRAVP
ncbi:pentapeptide repeat-containing protein [Streptomyces sp. NPDC004266]|uniref:pentapeptide repeat-containing protein n=1 Tax=Streptomyces sp. NPDC004266 TaxID=3364693 RepID=UPI0036780F8A